MPQLIVASKKLIHSINICTKFGYQLTKRFLTIQSLISTVECSFCVAAAVCCIVQAMSFPEAVTIYSI